MFLRVVLFYFFLLNQQASVDAEANFYFPVLLMAQILYGCVHKQRTRVFNFFFYVCTTFDHTHTDGSGRISCIIDVSSLSLPHSDFSPFTLHVNFSFSRSDVNGRIKERMRWWDVHNQHIYNSSTS